ncbi:MAG: ATP-dependent zinc metalloprotease FtsH [Chitinispirillales bacterium]|jgi:cell division protease FtsH|nr:ATP-dependent zinc metalloprotease FtsH [Chitinispirillales bacterium]
MAANIEQQEKEKKPDETPAPAGKSGMLRIFLWAFILTALFAYIFGSFGTPPVVTIPYSEFKKQVREGNISEVLVKGNVLEGTFVSDYESHVRGDSLRYSKFTTTKPDFDDSDLMGLLEAHGVSVTAKAGNNWFLSSLILLIPWLLIIGYFIYAGSRFQKQMRGGTGFPGSSIFSVGKSKAKRFRREMANISYADVAGLSNAKKDLQEIVDYLKDPGKFAALGATIPKGVLLMGPPGTGKTLLARSTAGEAGVPFFSTSGSEFVEMFVGVGASRVRDMFETAKREAPSLIFIDELDSIGRVRGSGLGGSHDEREQTLNQILTEMDGFESHESVVIIAATNRPDVLDPALTRPGRFDRQITLDLPQKAARLDILKIHSANVPVSPDIDMERIAARTVGFSGAELRNLVNEAALLAGRKGKTIVDAKDFDDAQDKILLGAEREDKLNEREKKIVAYHEAGHALVAKLIPHTDPLQKVTIIARGRTLGATEQIPDNDRHNFNRNYLLARISVALGGRVSEMLVFEELTSGAAQDLKQVTSIARKMVCQWGMSDKIGPATFSQGEEHPFLGKEISQPKDFSEHTARLIDEEVQRIILEQQERAMSVLSANRDKLDSLAAALMEYETLENGEVDRILGVAGMPSLN